MAGTKEMSGGSYQDVGRLLYSDQWQQTKYTEKLLRKIAVTLSELGISLDYLLALDAIHIGPGTGCLLTEIVRQLAGQGYSAEGWLQSSIGVEVDPYLHAFLQETGFDPSNIVIIPPGEEGIHGIEAFLDDSNIGFEKPVLFFATHIPYHVALAVIEQLTNNRTSTRREQVYFIFTTLQQDSVREAAYYPREDIEVRGLLDKKQQEGLLRFSFETFRKKLSGCEFWVGVFAGVIH